MGILTRNVNRADPTIVSSALYRITSCAQLLSDVFPEHLIGFALMWSGADRRHRENWSAFLERSEQLREEDLLHRFLVIHKQMGPPHYHRVLLCAGDPTASCLPLWENFMEWMRTQGTAVQQIRFANASEEDLSEWATSTTLPGFSMQQGPMPELCPWYIQDKRPVLHLVVEESRGQLILRGHVWPFRSHLEWSGGHIDAAGNQVAQRGQGTEYQRWTDTFPISDLPSQLANLHEFLMEISVQSPGGVVPPQVFDVIARHSWLRLRV